MRWTRCRTPAAATQGSPAAVGARPFACAGAVANRPEGAESLAVAACAFHTHAAAACATLQRASWYRCCTVPARAAALLCIQTTCLMVWSSAAAEGYVGGGDGGGFAHNAMLTHAILWGAVLSVYLASRSASALELKLLLTIIIPVGLRGRSIGNHAGRCAWTSHALLVVYTFLESHLAFDQKISRCLSDCCLLLPARRWR